MGLKLNVPFPKSDSVEQKSAKKKQDQDEPSDLMTVLATIRKTRGDKVVVPGSKIPIIRRLPTGIFEFDFYTGGGFPCGRYSIIYGKENSCKTNIALKAVASAQKLPSPCNKAIWVDVEHSFDPVWAAKLGVNVEELLVVNAGYGEEAVDLIDALVRAEDVAILVVDSIATLIANKEVVQSVENYDIGTSALLIKRMVNKLMVAFCEERKRDHEPCVILINQIRYKPGVLFGDPETMPGGEAHKFLAMLRVRFRSTDVKDKATNTVVSKETDAIIKKAKVPVRAASFKFRFAVRNHEGVRVGESDSFSMVKMHLQQLSLLVKQGQGYLVKLTAPPYTAGIMFTTITAIADRYEQDSEFRRMLQSLVIESYKDSFMLVEETQPGPVEVPTGQVQPIAGASDEADV